MNEELETEMEPDNVIDIFAVCVRKNTSTVGHLPLGKNGKFAKIFYFLRADQDAECKVVVTAKKSILATGMECKFLAS